MNGLDRFLVAGFIAGGTVLIAAASASVAPEPVLALLGSAACIVLLLNGNGREHVTAAPVPCVNQPPAIDPGIALFRRVRRSDADAEASTDSSGSGDDVSPRADAADESEDEAGASSALSYEEFTARVAEETETDEISFLPPYASGASSTTPNETRASSGLVEEVEAAASDTTKPDSKMPMPRHFALGTVAIIRKLLEPRDVERILEEQRRYPRLRFGDIAVQLGMLTELQLQELLLAQQQGVFTDAEIRDARDRLRSASDQTGDV